MSRVPILAGLAILLAGCAAKPPPSPASQAVPKRIVSLSPSVTEMLFAIGAGSRVVGVNSASNYPPAARRLPSVGSMSINYEALVALKPDLVVGQADLLPSALARSKQIGLRTLSLDTSSYEKTETAIMALGSAVDSVAGAGHVVKILERQRLAVERAIAGKPPVSVLFIAEAEPSVYAAGRKTFINDMIQRAGGVNAAKVDGFAVMSREALAEMEPGVILADAWDVRVLKRASWTSHSRIVAVPPDILVRPGPRLGDGLAWLTATLRHTEQSEARAESKWLALRKTFLHESGHFDSVPLVPRSTLLSVPGVASVCGVVGSCS